jgi:hypothetical protein
VATAIRKSTARFVEQGIDVENCLFGLDGSDDIESVVTTALRAGPWECVVVGGGVRKREDLLELFETLVNLVRQHAPGAAIVFNRTPADLVESVHRWLR